MFTRLKDIFKGTFSDPTIKPCLKPKTPQINIHCFFFLILLAAPKNPSFDLQLKSADLEEKKHFSVN